MADLIPYPTREDDTVIRLRFWKTNSSWFVRLWRGPIGVQLGPFASRRRAVIFAVKHMEEHGWLGPIPTEAPRMIPVIPA